jgi:hypothetical protein
MSQPPFGRCKLFWVEHTTHVFIARQACGKPSDSLAAIGLTLDPEPFGAAHAIKLCAAYEKLGTSRQNGAAQQMEKRLEFRCQILPTQSIPISQSEPAASLNSDAYAISLHLRFVLDTDVLVAALRSRDGASWQLVDGDSYGKMKL